jgi:transposase, IS6 family
VQHYAPELEKRCRPHLNATNDSWRVDETYIKVKKVWMYLYRAVDSQGNTLEFMLSPTRNALAAKSFFSKALAATHTSTPRVITVDKNAAYPKAFKELKAEGIMPSTTLLVSVIEWRHEPDSSAESLTPTLTRASSLPEALCSAVSTTHQPR